MSSLKNSSRVYIFEIYLWVQQKIHEFPGKFMTPANRCGIILASREILQRSGVQLSERLAPLGIIWGPNWGPLWSPSNTTDNMVPWDLRWLCYGDRRKPLRHSMKKTSSPACSDGNELFSNIGQFSTSQRTPCKLCVHQNVFWWG